MEINYLLFVKLNSFCEHSIKLMQLPYPLQIRKYTLESVKQFQKGKLSTRPTSNRILCSYIYNINNVYPFSGFNLFSLSQLLYIKRGFQKFFHNSICKNKTKLFSRFFFSSSFLLLPLASTQKLLLNFLHIMFVTIPHLFLQKIRTFPFIKMEHIF